MQPVLSASVRTLEAEVTINKKCLMGNKRNLGKVAFLKELFSEHFIFYGEFEGRLNREALTLRMCHVASMLNS